MTENRALATPLQALIDEEHKRTANAVDRLGSFVPLAQDAITFFDTFVTSIDEGHDLAAALLMAMQNSGTLAFLSYIRGHIAQGEFNCRQVIEYCALTTYMVANPREDVTRAIDNDLVGLKPPKEVSTKAYKWLAEEQPAHSELLKKYKDQINKTASHSSVYLTHFTFDWEGAFNEEDVYRGSFFDTVDQAVSQMHLMSLARLIFLVMDTLRLVAKRHGGFKLRNDAVDILKKLEHDIDEHRIALKEKMNLKAGPVT